MPSGSVPLLGNDGFSFGPNERTNPTTDPRDAHASIRAEIVADRAPSARLTLRAKLTRCIEMTC